MSRIVYVNGRFVPEAGAKISVFDRGFLFADGVYEVTAVIRGKLIDFASHMRRLRRSLGELAMASPASDEELLAIHRRIVSENALEEGLVYLQVTRGAADRDFLFPAEETVPSLVLFTQAVSIRDRPSVGTGLRVAVVKDLRWARRDIKTVQLLYPSMAKTEARRQGKDDAWMVEDGLVTEGTSNNAWIVNADGVLVTRPLSNDILHGITRGSIVRLAAEREVSVEERPFSLDEAKAAREAFITSASAFVMPVVEVDGTRIGDGRPGELTLRMRDIYIEESLKAAI